MAEGLHSKSINQIIDGTWDELVRDHRFLPHKGKENVNVLITAIETKIANGLSEMQSPPFTEFDRNNLTRKKDCAINEEIEKYRQYYEKKSETDAEYLVAAPKTIT